MGTDIHGVFQKRNKQNEWVDIDTKYEFNRHYQLFAFIGDVRNGFGFAGVRTGEHINPLTSRRGVPSDIQIDNFNDYGIIWLGDHSHSWFYIKEYFAHLEKAKSVIQTGIISRPHYEEWIKTYPDPETRKSPSSYANGIWGKDIVIVNDNEVEKQKHPHYTHIRVEWSASLKEEFDYFTKELVRLIAEHETEEIRFVFGFDS